jgi:hypothetical protein
MSRLTFHSVAELSSKSSLPPSGSNAHTGISAAGSGSAAGAESPLLAPVMWTVRPKVVASKQLTKAMVVGRTLAVSQVVFMLVSPSRSV